LTAATPSHKLASLTPRGTPWVQPKRLPVQALQAAVS
jgi:hypothetical protein